MIKIFGAALDPLDISERVDVKIAYLNWLKSHQASEDNFLDPYSYFEKHLKERNPSINEIEWIGRFPIDSWLTPKPSLSDAKYVFPGRYTEFLDRNGCSDYSDKLVGYLSENLCSSIPVMIGVDHCLTGAVLRYLKEKHGDYTILIFDSHCDIVDLETRKSYFEPYARNSKESFRRDIYECGSFLCHLLNKDMIRPENLWIIGTQDLDQLKKNADYMYHQKILPLIRQGMHIISKEELIRYGIPDEIEGKTYISFDMDLGSQASVLATRFLNYIGLNVEQILNLIENLSEKVRTNKIELIGLDIMEIDIHFLGANIEGYKDYTGEIVSQVIRKLVYHTSANEELENERNQF